MAVDPKSNKQNAEELTSAQGPAAPVRDKSPEAQYKPASGDSNNRTDAAAPSGPVNIPVKGASAEDAPEAGAPPAAQATGRGSRDSSSLPQD